MGFLGLRGWLGCSIITMRRHLAKRERSKPPPSPLYKPMQAQTRNPGTPSHFVLLCQVNRRTRHFGRNLAGLWSLMYSGEYIRDSMTHHHPRLTHLKTAPPPLKSPTLPEISATLHPIYNIIHYLLYIIFITNSFTDCAPKAQSNRRTAVGWSSSKAATHVVYYVRTFRHGSQIGAHHPGAAGWSTWATATGAGQWGPCRLKTLLLTKGRGQEIPALAFNHSLQGTTLPWMRRVLWDRS
jgi:hypothetical protein